MPNDPLPPELQKVIDDFGSRVEDIVTTFGKKLEETPTPDVIYHYTDGAGFRGILETGKFWFTDIFNLNDPSELRHGLEPAIKLISELAATGDPVKEAFSANFVKSLRGGIERSNQYFVCCFSTDPDDLGQWRAYSDNGRGFAIGFEGAALERALCTRDIDAQIFGMAFPVCYDETDLKEMQREMVSFIDPLLFAPKGLSKQQTNQYFMELATRLAASILRAALFFKHKAYHNEQEYRFVERHQRGAVADLKYRGRPYSLVRYVERNWKETVATTLKRIVIGPAADPLLAGQFVDQCLREFCEIIPPVTITSSAIPYRVP